MATQQCAICDLEDDEILLAVCNRCGIWYHLNPYQRPGRDCGDAVLGGEEVGVYYYCNPCLSAMQEEAMAAYRAAVGSIATDAEESSETTEAPAAASPASPDASRPARSSSPRRRFRRIDP